MNKELHYVILERGLKLPVNKDGDKIYVKSVDDKEINLVAFSIDLPDNLPVQSGCIHGFDGQVQVLRDSGCSSVVICRSVCLPEECTGEVWSCLMMDGHVTETPVVKKKVNTPYFIGEVEALAMENPPYDLVIGNIPNAREPSDPNILLGNQVHMNPR